MSTFVRLCQPMSTTPPPPSFFNRIILIVMLILKKWQPSARTQNQKPSFIVTFPFKAIQRDSKAFKAIQRFLRNYIFYFYAPSPKSTSTCRLVSRDLQRNPFIQKSTHPFIHRLRLCVPVARGCYPQNQGNQTDFRPLQTKKFICSLTRIKRIP